MLLIAENGLVDCELDRLCELLDLLDQKISEISALIRESVDPDAEGLLDRGEYFIGVGFVAIQQYLLDSLMFTGIEKDKAYKLGSVHSSGITYVALINSAANWWKHEAEWAGNNKVPKSGERTFIHITDVAETVGYELSVVLASLCGSGSLSLKGVVPWLVEWRNAVHHING